MELGGTYQNFIFSLGNCCGNLRLCLPCLCCVEYPYKQIDQSFVGIHNFTKAFTKDLADTSRQWGQVCNTSILSLIKFTLWIWRQTSLTWLGRRPWREITSKWISMLLSTTTSKFPERPTIQSRISTSQSSSLPLLLSGLFAAITSCSSFYRSEMRFHWNSESLLPVKSMSGELRSLTFSSRISSLINNSRTFWPQWPRKNVWLSLRS